MFMSSRYDDGSMKHIHIEKPRTKNIDKNTES